MAISRSRVNNEYKVPKTKTSVREFDLLPEAIEFLKKQMQHTYMLPPSEIEVRQRNNRTFAKESVRFVFHSSGVDRPWSGASPFGKVWAEILRKAKVRHRGPNQLRHTFIRQDRPSLSAAIGRIREQHAQSGTELVRDKGD